MSKLTQQTTHEFEGKKFKALPITTKRQDGLNQSLRIFLDEDGNTLLAVNQNDDVVLKVIGDSLTLIPIE